MKNLLRALASLSGLFLILALPVAVQAADPASTRFDTSVKSENASMRNTINKTRKQRAASKFQKAAAKKYSVNYDKTYSQIKSLRSSDASKMRSACRTNASKSTIKSAISRFEGRIRKLERAQAIIARDLRKIDKDKRKFWGDTNWVAFTGAKVTSAEFRKIVYGVNFYGTRPMQRISLDPGKKAPRSYKGGVTPEQVYLRAMSGHLGRIIKAYKRALTALKTKQTKLERKSGAKVKKKTPKGKKTPPPPTIPDH